MNFYVPKFLLGNIKQTSPRFLNDFINKNKHIRVFTVSFQKHTHVSMSESNLAGNTCAMAIPKGHVLGNIEAFPGLCPLSMKSCLWVHENMRVLSPDPIQRASFFKATQFALQRGVSPAASQQFPLPF